MKLVKELIEYFYNSGELDKDDLSFFEKEGFYSVESEPKNTPDNEDSDIHADEHPLSIEDTEAQKAVEDMSLTRKGKGRRAFKPEKKWSLEQFNSTLLPQIEALDDTFSPLYRLVAKLKKAEMMRESFYHPYMLNDGDIKATLEGVLLYHYGQELELATAVLMTDYWESFFVLSKKLSPKNRDRVRAWISGKKLLLPEPHREALFWARQMLDLQIRILKMWCELTPSVVKHHQQIGYEAPFLTQSVSPKEGRLAAQLLMSFIYLHNFDKPPKPETTLLLLLDKEGIEDAKQTISVFFPSEMHELEQRMPDVAQFDVPFWLYDLNERHHKKLFWATHLWTFTYQKQSVSFPFTHTRTGQKIVLGEAVCEKSWFTWTKRQDRNDIYAGVFCAEYEEVGVFSEGMAAVRQGDFWGFIDARGILVIPCQYCLDPSESTFTEGVVLCRRASDDKYLFLNKEGQEAFPNLEKELGSPLFYAFPFSEGYTCVKVFRDGDYSWHIIDRLGRVSLGIESTENCFIKSSFNEGLAVFINQITGNFGLISPLGKQCIIENTEVESYDYIHPFREGRAAIRSNADKWGFVDAECRLVIPCMYDWAWSFSEERSAVCRDGLWGFIDRDGNEIIPPQYDMTEHFWNGLGGFGTASGDWGFLNKDGRVLNNGFGSTKGFSEGQAIVSKHGHRYFCNTQGVLEFCHHFNPTNLTEGYFVCSDPPSALKILTKNYRTCCTIENIQSAHYFAKDMNAFEWNRRDMFGDNCFSASPYTIEHNWCLSEGFIGVRTEKSGKCTFAFFDEAVQKISQTQAVLFKTIRIQNDLLLVDEQQNIGIKIPCPFGSYVDFELKSNNCVLIKIGEEAIILRLDLIFEKIWKTKI